MKRGLSAEHGALVLAQGTRVRQPRWCGSALQTPSADERSSRDFRLMLRCDSQAGSALRAVITPSATRIDMRPGGAEDGRIAALGRWTIVGAVPDRHDIDGCLLTRALACSGSRHEHAGHEIGPWPAHGQTCQRPPPAPPTQSGDKLRPRACFLMRKCDFALGCKPDSVCRVLGCNDRLLAPQSPSRAAALMSEADADPPAAAEPEFSAGARDSEESPTAPPKKKKRKLH